MLTRRLRFSDPRLALSVWLGALLLPCATLAADDRPATLAAAGGNPLALNAMAFLGWYWKLLLILAGLTALLRLFGGGLSKRVRSAPGLGEDLYLMAYLAGGPQRVLESVMASLVEQGALRVNAVTRELIPEQTLSEDRPKLERRVQRLLSGTRQVADAARFRRWLKRELRTSLAAMRERLLRAGLLARPPLQAKAVKPLTIGFGALLTVGALRLVAGIAAGRPVGFLVLSMLLTGVVAWWLLRGFGRERATAQGERLLDACKPRLRSGGAEAEEKTWTVALLGLAGYGMGPMADLHHLLQVPAGRSLLGGNGSGDASGGSCGGGGCGGGGCGGGGCGG